MNDLSHELAATLRLGRRGRARRTSACPEIETLAALADGRVPAERRSDLEAHLADCRHCLGQLGLLTRLARADGPPSSVPARWLAAAAGRRRAALVASRLWAAAAAATLLVALGVAWRLASPVGSPPGSEVRSGAGPTAPEGLAVLQPVEGATVDPGELSIRWSPLAGTLFYRLRLTDAAGELLWQARIAGADAPASVAPAPPAGGPYFLWIEARLPDGRTFSSRAVAFHVGAGGGG